VFNDYLGATRQSEIKQLALKYHPLHNITFEYTIIPGFAIQLTPTGVAYLQTFEEIEYIEEDRRVFAACTTENDSIWNLARVSTRGPPVWDANSYEYEENGSGVKCFVLDTGVRITHNEFSGGRATFGANFVAGEDNNDGNGHGTHVASTVAGATYGVAKGASIVAVKVLASTGSGSTVGVIAGIEWVAQNAIPNKDTALMAIGGGASVILDQACNNLVSLGIFLAVPAGSSAGGACNTSPARAANVFTVGAIAKPVQGATSDVRTPSSSYGPCLKAFAPGEAIIGAWIGSDSAVQTLSGTSAASAHAAGVASLVLSRTSQHPNATRDEIINNANKNTISNPGTGSPNVVVYAGCNVVDWKRTIN